MPPKIEKIDTLHKGWNTFSIATIRLEGGAVITRAVEDHGSAIAVLVYDPERKTALLVRQFRAPTFIAAQLPDLLEAIAGLIEDEDPQATARREAMEEAGVQIGALEPVGRVWAIPGSSTERIDLFLASYCAADRVAEGGGLDHEHENITVVEMPLAELAAMADRGELADLKTLGPAADAAPAAAGAVLKGFPQPLIWITVCRPREWDTPARLAKVHSRARLLQTGSGFAAHWLRASDPVHLAGHDGAARAGRAAGLFRLHRPHRQG